jgi:dienelactone hydrolase
VSRQKKLLAKVQNNPRAVSFEDLDLLLTWHGFERRQSRRGTSHYVYRYGHHAVTVARHKPHIHSKTVRDALNAIAEILEEEKGSEVRDEKDS